jgi:eukaryotic-like serine/threonine-protein kinase
VIGGKFCVERVIGEGGMGVVVAAKHMELDEHVAIKFLRKNLAGDGELVARFTQEARDAVKLKSEYVARTFDVGVDDGCPYIVMEFLEGHDLGRELELKGTLPIDVAAEYMIQACAGVAAAHARGIVHRDIKPENIFLAERGDGSSIVKILDFGISKAVQTSVHAGRSPILGSPYYMSPEQLRGGEIDFRSDIWSLGAVLFELLAGVPAFDTEQPLGPLLRAIQRDAPRKLTDFRPMAPAELEELILQCMQKEPEHRIESAAELSIALLKFAPKRARVAAERASSVTRAAGLSSEAKLVLPPSTAPPPTDEARTSVPHIPSSGRLPSASIATPSVRSVTPGASEISAAIEAPVQGDPKKKVLLLLAAAAFVALLLGVFAFTRSGGTPAAAASPSGTAPVTLGAGGLAPAVATQAAAATPAPVVDAVDAKADDPAPSQQPRTVPRATPPAWGGGRRVAPAPVTPQQTATPAPPPSRPDLDIRMTR